MVGTFLVAQLVKNPPALRETWVQSLGREDPREKGTATHSSILAWRIPGTIQSTGSQRIGHDGATFTFTGWVQRRAKTSQHCKELSVLRPILSPPPDLKRCICKEKKAPLRQGLGGSRDQQRHTWIQAVLTSVGSDLLPRDPLLASSYSSR